MRCLFLLIFCFFQGVVLAEESCDFFRADESCVGQKEQDVDLSRFKGRCGYPGQECYKITDFDNPLNLNVDVHVRSGCIYGVRYYQGGGRSYMSPSEFAGFIDIIRSRYGKHSWFSHGEGWRKIERYETDSFSVSLRALSVTFISQSCGKDSVSAIGGLGE